MKYLAILLILVSTGAQARYVYDYSTGNVYNVRQAANGQVVVQGYNQQTGSTWNSVHESDGSQRGVNAQGEGWSYNNHATIHPTPGMLCNRFQGAACR